MSDEARDFIESLLCFDASRRLGANGADEVKRHPWLKDIDWVRLRDAEANFVPMTTDPESTDYFDSRGAIDHVFQDDSDAVDPVAGSVARNDNLVLAASEDHSRPGRHSERSAGDDFGTFNFKNLDVLKQANDDIVKKLRNEHIIPSEPIASTVASSTGSRGSVSMGSALSTDADKVSFGILRFSTQLNLVRKGSTTVPVDFRHVFCRLWYKSSIIRAASLTFAKAV